MIRNKICTIGIIYNVVLLAFFVYIGVFAGVGHIPQPMNLGLIGGACGNGAIAILVICLTVQEKVAKYSQIHGRNKAETKLCTLCTSLPKSHISSMNPTIPVINPDRHIVSIENSTDSTENHSNYAGSILHVLTLFPKIWIRAYHLFRMESTATEDNLFMHLT